jgi:hypothetical protein
LPPNYIPIETLIEGQEIPGTNRWVGEVAKVFQTPAGEPITIDRGKGQPEQIPLFTAETTEYAECLIISLFSAVFAFSAVNVFCCDPQCLSVRTVVLKEWNSPRARSRGLPIWDNILTRPGQSSFLDSARNKGAAAIVTAVEGATSVPGTPSFSKMLTARNTFYAPIA